MTAAWWVATWVSTPPIMGRAEAGIGEVLASVWSASQDRLVDGPVTRQIERSGSYEVTRTRSSSVGQWCWPTRPTGPKQDTRSGQETCGSDDVGQHFQHDHWKHDSAGSPRRRAEDPAATLGLAAL